jgi:hypothetical protein
MLQFKTQYNIREEEKLKKHRKKHRKLTRSHGSLVHIKMFRLKMLCYHQFTHECEWRIK